MNAYIHGTDLVEQGRLAVLNKLLNEASLDEIDFRGVRDVVEVGCGTGHFAAAISRRLEAGGRVIGIDSSESQIATAHALYPEAAVEWKIADAAELSPDSCDLAHARFLLEHLADPQSVVNAMAGAVRPGGRVVLEDDDHDLLRVWPEVPEFMLAWRAYYETYASMRCDPFIGRKLVQMMHRAGLGSVRTTWLNFGGCRDEPHFDRLIENLHAVVAGARDRMVSLGTCDERTLERGLNALARWSGRDDAALWFAVAWAEGRKKGERS